MKKIVTLALLVTCFSAFATSSHNFFTHFIRLHFPGEAEMQMCITKVMKKVAAVDAVVSTKVIREYDYSEVLFLDEQVISLTNVGDHFFGKAIQLATSHSHSHDTYVGLVVTYMVTFEDGSEYEYGPFLIDTTLDNEGKSTDMMEQELELEEDASSTFSLVCHFGYAS